MPNFLRPLRLALGLLAALLAALLAGAPAAAWAEAAQAEDAAKEAVSASAAPEPERASIWRINTFGTLGLARLGMSHTRLRADGTATDGIGSHWTAAFDSRAAVQVSVTPLAALDLTWQPLLRRQPDGHVGPSTHRAYATWRVTPQWELRAGRFQSPLFLVSDEREVGLAQPWVRPPQEVYGLLGNVETLDGLWLRRRIPVGDETLMIDLYQARHRDEQRQLSVEHRPITGLNLSLGDSRWTWHAMWARSRTHIRVAAIEPFLAVLADPALGGNAAAAPDYDLRNLDPIHFASLGLRREADGWLVMAELASARIERRSAPGATGAYLTVGRGLGSWTPSLTWARVLGRDPGPDARFSGAAAAVAAQF
ncbi:MAG: hypothetical protein AB9M60_05020, partial [Leptothrix sp. (in: b-proteobacteria)]